VRKLKKVLALSLALAMGLSLVACGGSDTADTATDATDATEATESTDDSNDATEATDDTTDTSDSSAGITAPDASGWDESKKIYAYSWDDDFEKKLNVVLDAYPEYKDYVEYINLGVASEESLESIDNAITSGDKYPSLIPADIGSAKYWTEDDSKTANLYDLGFTEDMINQDYSFVKEFAEYNGALKAVTWQNTAGSVFYRRDIAKEVFGTDDPEAIQAELADWDKFFAAADKLKEKGYSIVAGPKEIYYAIINAHTQPWVTVADDGTETLTLDSSVSDFLEKAKKLYDGGYTLGATTWDGDWAAGMTDDSKVFCYFGCPWFIGVMTGNGATEGNWAACVGPQSYYWGGTFVSIGKDTPNPELAAFICYELACDPEIGVQITNITGDAVANKEANTRLESEIASDNAGVKFLGGQNPYATWAAAAENVDQSAVTYSDKFFEQYISDAMNGYNTGTYATVDDAIQYVKDQAATELGIKEAE